MMLLKLMMPQVGGLQSELYVHININVLLAFFHNVQIV